MTLNESGLDRVLRVLVGLLLVGLAVNGNIGAWGWIGLLLVLTGAVGFCPAYRMLGIKTCGKACGRTCGKACSGGSAKDDTMP